MLLNVQELVTRKEPVTLEDTFDVTELFKNMRDVKPLSPLNAKLTAVAAEPVVDVTGKLTGKVELQCARCLTHFEEDYDIAYRETFKRVPKEVAEKGEQDDEDFVPFHGERIELRPYVEEELVLSLPFAPLCMEDCRGLDPDTGESLNGKPDVPKALKIDPRLEALQNWFDPDRQ